MEGVGKSDESTVVHLNVGGAYFSTYKSTLCKYPGTMLEVMFSGRHVLIKDSDGRYFIDRPPKPFRSILTFLQTGQIYWPTKSEDKKLLEDEINYFGLNEVLSIAPHFDTDDSLLMTPSSSLFFADAGLKYGNLLYRGSRDGFSRKRFHDKCANSGSTLTVIKYDNILIGGYTERSWTKNLIESTNQSDMSTSWLFTTGPEKAVKYKARSTASTSSANNKGPWFGNKLGDYDIFVDLELKLCYISGTNGYEAPLYFGLGMSCFNIGDVEVFAVNTIKK